jgi:hypothetical protein
MNEREREAIRRQASVLNRPQATFYSVSLNRFFAVTWTINLFI